MQDLRSNQSEAVAERPLATPASEQAELVDVVFDRDLYRAAPLVGLVIGGSVAAVVLVIVLKSFSFAPAVQNTVIAAALVAGGSFVWAIILHLRNEGCRRVRRVLADSAGADLPSRIERLLPIACSLYPQGLVREAVKALAAEGHFGTAIRIAPFDQATGIDPIAVPFEPRRFDDLAEVEPMEPPQTEAKSDNDGGAPRDRERAASPATVPRGIRRNLILKGGWIVLVVLGFNWVLRAIESFQRRTITPYFMLMTVAMLALLLVPVGHNWITGRQWLAVPAGIVLRKGKWLKRRWNLHLFDRRESVLVVYKLHRRQWVLVVANRDACESVMGTKQELESVLRAWLSPLASPTLEQLSDLC